MPRPRQCRYVATTPSVTYFKPRGIPMTALEEVCLGVEELEALRLADLEGLTGSEAACRMRVSRHTFGRTLAAARDQGQRHRAPGPAHRGRSLRPGRTGSPNCGRKGEYHAEDCHFQ